MTFSISNGQRPQGWDNIESFRTPVPPALPMGLGLLATTAGGRAVLRRWQRSWRAGEAPDATTTDTEAVGA